MKEKEAKKEKIKIEYDALLKKNKEKMVNLSILLRISKIC